MTPSLMSSDPAASALLAPSQEEQEMSDEDAEVETESSKTSCPAYGELLEFMEANKEGGASWSSQRSATSRPAGLFEFFFQVEFVFRAF